MRAARLLTILRVLQVEGRVTAGQLARRLEVSERTVLRDLTELGSTGVPVYAVRGPGGGFELLDTFRAAAAAHAAPATEPGPIRRVRVRISPEALQRVLISGTPEGWRPRPVPDVWPDRDDWVEGSFAFTSDDDALRTLPMLGPDVEVLLPESLRTSMLERAMAVASLHRGG
jgi:predicted DNA-binding transcriptional regulator YafY